MTGFDPWGVSFRRRVQFGSGTRSVFSPIYADSFFPRGIATTHLEVKMHEALRLRKPTRLHGKGLRRRNNCTMILEPIPTVSVFLSLS